MNDYIAKPVDEKLLYSKILGHVRKNILSKESVITQRLPEKIKRCIDLAYLLRSTKSDPQLMMEMITLYLEQTTVLVGELRASYQTRDWALLQSTTHKMIPSFSIMGIGEDFENMARKVQDYARAQQETDGISDLVLQLENICNQACNELTEEFNIIKNARS